jgi:hypothetical protein
MEWGIVLLIVLVCAGFWAHGWWCAMEVKGERREAKGESGPVRIGSEVCCVEDFTNHFPGRGAEGR